MTSTDEQVPEELQPTVRALRHHAEQLPTAGRADLQAAIESGRRQVRRRRTLTLAAGLAAAVVVGLGVAGGLDAPRREGAPARPVPDATVTVDDGKRPVTAIYAQAELVLESAGVQTAGRLSWDVGDSVLYGPPAAYISGQPTAVPAPPGFPDDGYHAEGARALVELAGGGVLTLTTYRVDGGLPLEKDYCAWWNTIPSVLRSSCAQSPGVDGGQLLRLDDFGTLTYIWSGGQVEVTRGIGPDDTAPGEELTWEAMERIVTDPRLRW